MLTFVAWTTIHLESLSMRAGCADFQKTKTFHKRTNHGRSVVPSSTRAYYAPQAGSIFPLFQQSNSPHKCESSTLPRESILGDVHISHFTILFEHSSQIIRRCSVGQVPHFQRHHAINSWRRPTVTHFGNFETLNSQKEKTNNLACFTLQTGNTPPTRTGIRSLIHGAIFFRLSTNMADWRRVGSVGSGARRTGTGSGEWSCSRAVLTSRRVDAAKNPERGPVAPSVSSGAFRGGVFKSRMDHGRLRDGPGGGGGHESGSLLRL